MLKCRRCSAIGAEELSPAFQGWVAVKTRTKSRRDGRHLFDRCAEMQFESQYVTRAASADDVDTIVSLINRAFAVARFFKSGDRTDPEQVQQMMKDGRFLLLIDKGEIVACVFVKITGERGYLGTLSVDPERQKSGLGTRMMHEAEDYFRAAGCKVVDIRLVNLRTELPGIYRKFGFVETGTQSAEVIKNATRPIHFITMSKEL
jgi:ribosomal protein S18 acetylase RimI-like enzyme